MGRMTGAAGFKRDSVGGGNMPNPGLTGFSYNDPSQPRIGGTTQTSSFGMQNQDEMNMGSGVKGTSPMGSARRMKMPSEVTASIDSNTQNRPPVYVPTRRDPGR